MCSRTTAGVCNSLWLTCVVISGKGQSCHDLKELAVHHVTGYLSSAITERTGRGSRDCPWLITTQEQWQRINLTLIDFSSASSSFSSSYTSADGGGDSANVPGGGIHLLGGGGRGEGGRGSHCHKYAVIHEQSKATREAVVCGDRQREKVVYVSTTNQVTVEMIRLSPEKRLSFVIHFVSKSAPRRRRRGRGQGAGNQLLLSVRLDRQGQTEAETMGVDWSCRGDWASE